MQGVQCTHYFSLVHAALRYFKIDRLLHIFLTIQMMMVSHNLTFSVLTAYCFFHFPLSISALLPFFLVSHLVICD